MQTIRPLTRTFRSKIIPPTSNIPHINYHIQCKAKEARKFRSYQYSGRPHYRSQTTLVNSSDLSITHPQAEDQEQPSPTSDIYLLNEENNNSTSHYASNPPTSLTSARSFFEASRPEDASNDVKSSAEPTVITAEILQEAHPERVLSWLEFHPEGQAFIATASDEAFEDAFCALDPYALLEPFKQALWHTRGQGIGGPDFNFQKSLVLYCRSFAERIDNILATRQYAGVKLSLPVCRHALKCAALIGDARMANHIWEKTMPMHTLEPDIACYNAYMEAHIWNLGFSQAARHDTRATPRNLHLRSLSSRPKHLWGYSTGGSGTDNMPSLKASALELFKEISQKGLVPTEDTFANLMISLARSGDINGPESILKSVWNIDVNLLDSFDEEEIQSPTFYPDDHPLRPTSKLLWAVAHCYGITSQGSKAWSLLDYISRNYALQIPPLVWNELIERTYVLSKQFSGTRRAQGHSEGKLASVEVEKLYNILTDEPHNLSPTPIISDLLTRSYRARRMREKTLGQLQKADRALGKQAEVLQLMNQAFWDLSQHTSALLDNGMLSRSFLQLRRDFQMVYLDVRLRIDLLSREAYRMVKEPDFAGSGRYSSWSRRKLPQLVEHMHQYLPHTVRYKIRTGRVKLELRSISSDPLSHYDIYQTLRESHLIWTALEPTNLFEVASNLEKLSSHIGSSDRSIRPK